MSETHDSRAYRARRRYLAPLIGLGLALALVLAAAPLSIVAMQNRLITPPAFAFKIGGVEFAAPCPARRRLDCSPPLPWYAIWRGDPEPDGTTSYREIFFIYLKPDRRR
jgi:hypothetical protein